MASISPPEARTAMCCAWAGTPSFKLCSRAACGYGLLLVSFLMMISATFTGTGRGDIWAVAYNNTVVVPLLLNITVYEAHHLDGSIEIVVGTSRRSTPGGEVTTTGSHVWPGYKPLDFSLAGANEAEARASVVTLTNGAMVLAALSVLAAFPALPCVVLRSRRKLTVAGAARNSAAFRLRNLRSTTAVAALFALLSCALYFAALGRYIALVFNPLSKKISAAKATSPPTLPWSAFDAGLGNGATSVISGGAVAVVAGLGLLLAVVLAPWAARPCGVPPAAWLTGEDKDGAATGSAAAAAAAASGAPVSALIGGATFTVPGTAGVGSEPAAAPHPDGAPPPAYYPQPQPQPQAGYPPAGYPPAGYPAGYPQGAGYQQAAAYPQAGYPPGAPPPGSSYPAGSYPGGYPAAPAPGGGGYPAAPGGGPPGAPPPSASYGYPAPPAGGGYPYPAAGYPPHPYPGAPAGPAAPQPSAPPAGAYPAYGTAAPAYGAAPPPGQPRQSGFSLGGLASAVVQRMGSAAASAPAIFRIPQPQAPQPVATGAFYPAGPPMQAGPMSPGAPAPRS